MLDSVGPKVRIASLVGLLLGAAVGGMIVHYQTTPTPVLGHADPHAAGPIAVVERALAGSDALIAQIPGATSSSPPPPAQPAQVQETAPRTGLWIEIPSLSIGLPIQKGDGSDRIPPWKALVYPGTAWPGSPGNSYIYAHGDWEMFGSLLYAKLGDTAYIHDYNTGAIGRLHVSRVVGKVAYNDTRWVSVKSATPMLTLQTCVDYNPRGERFIVQLT